MAASPMFSDAGVSFTDEDGNTITATVETVFYLLGRPGLKRVRRAFFGTAMGGSSSATLSYTTAPNGSYSVSEDSLTNNGGYTRQKVDLNSEAFGVAFKIEKTGAGSFALHDIEVESWPLEGSRV